MEISEFCIGQPFFNNTHVRKVAVVNSQTSDTMSGESVEAAQIIVGTSCAGTGLDKRNVGQVIAVGLPFSIEQVLQWAGRCRASGNITVIVPSWHMRCGGELAGANDSRQIVDDCSNMNSMWCGSYRQLDVSYHTFDVIGMGRNHA